MAIPGTFKFMSQTWRILPGTAKDIGNDLGQCQADDKVIYLSPNYTEDTVIETLFHEIFHCFEVTLNQHLTEDQVDTMSKAFVHFFKENQDFAKLFITEDTDHGQA